MNKISTCIYCGCGCLLNYVVEGNKIVNVLPVVEDEVSEGKPCIKGLTIKEVYDKNRITTPMIRKKGKLVPVTYSEAVDFIYKNIKDLSPDEIFVNGSGKMTNEDNYAVLKFARVVLQTANADSCCGRLCHATTVQAMNEMFGQSNLTVMDNIKKADTLLIVGSNPFSNYPVFFNRLKKIKIVSVQNIFNFHTKEYDVNLKIKPGSETALLNGLINSLIKRGLSSKEEGFEELKKTVSSFTKEVVCSLCEISEKDYDKFVDAIYESKKLAVMHGMGLTQHVNGLENIHSIMNLVILKKAFVQTLRGEINVQGVGDIGFLPNSLPTGDYSSVPKLEKIWKAEINKSKGKTILEALAINPVKAAFVIHFNPAQSMPALNKVHKILKKMFIIQIESVFNETSKYANVIIPSPLLLETEGTITNGEKRIRKANQVIKPPGKVVDEWLFFEKLANKFNKTLGFKSKKEILKEIKKTVPSYSKINVSKLWEGEDQWADKSIKFLKFIPEKYEGIDETSSKQYPFILTTFRSQFQFLTGEQTTESAVLKKLDDGPCFYFNEKDMKKLEIKNKEQVIVESTEGKVKAKAISNNKIPEGIIATRFHYKKLLINKLFPLMFDEETFTPNYKAVAVKVKKA